MVPVIFILCPGFNNFFFEKVYGGNCYGSILAVIWKFSVDFYSEKWKKGERKVASGLFDGRKKMGVRILVNVFLRYYGFVGVPGGWAVFMRMMSVFVSVIVQCRTCLTWVSVYV